MCIRHAKGVPEVGTGSSEGLYEFRTMDVLPFSSQLHFIEGFVLVGFQNHGGILCGRGLDVWCRNVVTRKAMPNELHPDHGILVIK